MFDWLKRLMLEPGKNVQNAEVLVPGKAKMKMRVIRKSGETEDWGTQFEDDVLVPESLFKEEV